MPAESPNLNNRIVKRIVEIFREYPNQFWVLVGGTFIDRLGGALLFPFFTLYITRKFGVGMTEVGVIFSLFALSTVAGSMFGGALTDRLGRKGMIIFGLVTSALSSLGMGFVNRIEPFYLVTIFVGLLSNTAGPAQQAMVADLLPEKQRAQGYGILRVVVNLAVTFGPMIGGLLAAQSYLFLFIGDATTSLITACIVALALRETLPTRKDSGSQQESLSQTFGGYLKVGSDVVFMWFLGASILMVLVYMQMNTTLGVYLRDSHGITEQYYGYILSLNAAMVVFLQFPITRWISKYRPFLIMAVGTLLYSIGFAMYGFVSLYVLFLLAMVIITIGEMLISPTGQAIVAHLSPEDMRGRYMAVFGFSWLIPSAFGPLLAGLVMDNFDPRWVWLLSGIIGTIAAGAFYLLERRVSISHWVAVDRKLDLMQQVEEGLLSAESASDQMDKISTGPWGKLAGDSAPVESRRMLHIRVTDLESEQVLTETRLPLGLVDSALQTGGQVSDELKDIPPDQLSLMVSRSIEQGLSQTTLVNRRFQVTVMVE